jgi:hypothetical protein
MLNILVRNIVSAEAIWGVMKQFFSLYSSLSLGNGSGFVTSSPKLKKNIYSIVAISFCERFGQLIMFSVNVSDLSMFLSLASLTV